jgi:hypothetical protein
MEVSAMLEKIRILQNESLRVYFNLFSLTECIFM